MLVVFNKELIVKVRCKDTKYFKTDKLNKKGTRMDSFFDFGIVYNQYL